MADFWSPMAESLSSFGQMINAPVLMNWDTQAARQDAFTGAQAADGSAKRGTTSAAYQTVANTPSAISGNTQYNAFGDPIGGQTGTTTSSNGASNGSEVAGFTASNGITYPSQVAYNATLRKNIGVKQGGYASDANSTAAGNRLQYNNDNQDFVTGLRSGQNTINSGRINNALNLRRSMASIAGGIRQGIRSGAVNLANMNAVDSGASEAMARAFARQGNAQAGSANNEAQLKENELATTQTNLNMQKEQGLGRLKSWRDNKVGEISQGLYQKLAELDAQAQNEGLNGAVDMGLRDRIVSEASQALDQIDAMTQSELAKISGLGYDQIQAEASKMDAAGAVANNPFSVEASTVQFGQPGGGTGNMAGAPIGPIGTTPRYRDDQTYPVAAWNKDDTKVA